MEGSQVRETVATVVNVMLNLAKKSRAELTATLSLVSDDVWQLVLQDLPMGWLRHVNSLEAVERTNEKKKKEAKTAEKKRSKKEQDKEKEQEQETKVLMAKKRTYEENLSFTAFYTKIKQSMIEARDHGALEKHVLASDSRTLDQVLRDAQNIRVQDPDVVGIKEFIEQALIAERSTNSFAIVQAVTIGRRFFEVFGYHLVHKDSDRFVRKGWMKYADYLGIVAPGVSVRQERNYRRLFELHKVFPCVELISGCSVTELISYMKQFRDLLERDDNEALQWRCPIDKSKHAQMQFQRKIKYVANGNLFAEYTVVGNHQDAEEFLEQKDDILSGWNNEDAADPLTKRQKMEAEQDGDEDSLNGFIVPDAEDEELELLDVNLEDIDDILELWE